MNRKYLPINVILYLLCIIFVTALQFPPTVLVRTVSILVFGATVNGIVFILLSNLKYSDIQESNYLLYIVFISYDLLIINFSHLYVNFFCTLTIMSFANKDCFISPLSICIPFMSSSCLHAPDRTSRIILRSKIRHLSLLLSQVENANLLPLHLMLTVGFLQTMRKFPSSFHSFLS